MSTVITDASQAKALKFGDQFIVEPEGFTDAEHDPLAFAEAHAKLRAEVAEVLAELEPPKDIRETVTVEFVEGYALVTSSIDQEVKLSGAVRDGTVKLSAGKTSKRKLTGEGHGYVSVNGQEFAA